MEIKTFFSTETPEFIAVRLALQKLNGEQQIEFLNWLGSSKLHRDPELMQNKIEQIIEREKRICEN